MTPEMWAAIGCLLIAAALEVKHVITARRRQARRFQGEWWGRGS